MIFDFTFEFYGIYVNCTVPQMIFGLFLGRRRIKIVKIDACDNGNGNGNVNNNSFIHR